MQGAPSKLVQTIEDEAVLVKGGALDVLTGSLWPSGQKTDAGSGCRQDQGNRNDCEGRHGDPRLCIRDKCKRHDEQQSKRCYRRQ